MPRQIEGEDGHAITGKQARQVSPGVEVPVVPWFVDKHGPGIATRPELAVDG